MLFEEVSTQNAPAPGGHYSQAIKDGNVIWTSGQVGKNAETGEVPTEFADQTRQMLINLQAVLAEGGATLNDVVKTNCFITDVGRFAEFNDLYAEFFGDHRPARSTVGTSLAGAFVVEIEAVAVLRTGEE